jgi:transcriptional regulator with XRE-family HTH domain
MQTSERIKERRTVLGLSQAKLAALVGVTQPTIGKLEAGISLSSTYIHKIARALNTTVEYLDGETDDPDKGAALPPLKPTVQIATMQVLLPDVRALERMFLGALKASEGLSQEALARELALLLPKGLGLLQGR